MKKTLFALLAALSFCINAFAAININTASKEELETLDGVGPVKAQAIIDYRKKHGSFKTVDELDNVPGFGEKTMANVKSQISVGGRTTLPATAVKPEAKSDKATKENKPAKELSVGNEKAAAKGKTSDQKSVKEEKPAKGKEPKSDKKEKSSTKDKKSDKKDKAGKTDTKEKKTGKTGKE